MSDTKVKTYVEFKMPGYFFPERETHEVTDRDPSKLDIPENVYALSYYDVAETKVTVQGKKQILTGDAFNVSPTYFIGGQIYTPDEIEKDFPHEGILIANARSMGTLIRCRTGNWQPFDKNDVVLEL